MQQNSKELLVKLLEKAKHCPNSVLIRNHFLKLHDCLNSVEFKFEEFSNSFDFLTIHARHLLKEYFYSRR